MPDIPAAWSAGPTVRRLRGRARTAEAMVLLGAASAAQRWIPMRYWSHVLGVAGPVPVPWLDRAVTKLPQRAAPGPESQVSRSVHRGAAALPWDPTCLARATAGQVMLRRRGQPAVVVIGLRPGPHGTDRAGHWDAHAWLLGRRGALTGGPAAAGFTATTVFEVPHALTAADVDLSPPGPAPAEPSQPEPSQPPRL